MGWALHWVAVLFVVASRGGAAGCDSGCANQNRKNDVTYDGRSLIINDEHKILFSGSIHYPRSTPQMWPDLIAKAKQGGLDVIQTYVFWNVHEPRRLEYDFTGRLDLVRFIKEIQKQGLYACLRIGPFIEAEWNYGGFPFWLHDVRGIVFRTNNEPFKFYMQDFTTKIVNMMKSEKLFASQGGPIILSQIENEYQNVEAAFHEGGPPYVRWAAGMAVNLTTGVPWVMCKQDDAPDPVINACNGLQCGVTFKGPNSDKKPSIWTENWTMQYQVFGNEPRLRSAADIAFHVALFVIMKNGSYINYYMYHGGTNFGRTASSFALTSYYDYAPLDEYGLIRQPQWGHLKDLHAAIKLCVKPLLWGTYTRFPLSSNQMQYAYVFRYNSSSCAAFLVNSDTREDATVLFQKLTYVLPRKSISILPDCKNVAFNTAKVSTQYSTRSVQSGSKLRSIQQWQEYKEAIPDFGKTTIRAKGLLEHMNMTKDSSDYLWYTTRVPSDPNNPQPMIYVRTLGHLLHAFVNGVQVGSGHGTHNSPGFTKQFQVNLTKGMNNISLLSVMVGLPDAGAYLERRAAGINQVQIQGKDLTESTWGYKVGLMGEALQIYSELGSKKVHWSKLGNGGAPLTWYKTLFNAPTGNAPVALNLSSMGKGEAWVNGQSIGRYWVSFLTSKGNPAQTMYHIPRSFLKSRNNLLVLMEEENNAHPLEISIDTISLPAGPPVDAISLPKLCEHVSEPHLSQTKIQNESNEEDKKLYRRIPQVQLQCPSIRNISNIIFASFGNPSGDCNGYAIGSCHLANSKAVAEEACLGKKRCTISLTNQIFGSDPCPGVPKTLIVHAQCT